MYTYVNFKSKKALKEAVARGDKLEIYQPGPFGNGDYSNGTFCVEGPHYPEPHKWYASVVVKNGYIVSVK